MASREELRRSLGAPQRALIALVSVSLLWLLPGVALAAETCGGVEATIVGTEAADVIVGTRGPDVIVGLGGDDDIRGMAGDDLVCGGDGDDFISGGHGNDTLWGDAGRDRVLGAQGADTVYGGDDNDVLRGNVGPDVLDAGAGDDRLTGGEGADRLAGGPGDDRLEDDRGASIMTGGPGADRLIGGAGADELSGDDGDDEIFGFAGPDAIDGGPGTDLIDGGDGKDTCVGGEDVAGCETVPVPDQCPAADISEIRDCLDDPRASDPATRLTVLITADLILGLGEQIVVSGANNLHLTADPGVVISETTERMAGNGSFDRQYVKLKDSTAIELSRLTIRDAAFNDLATQCRAGTHPTKPQGWTPGPCYSPLMLDGATDIVINGIDITSHKAVLIDLREVNGLTIRNSTIAEATVFGVLFQSAFPHTDVSLIGNIITGTGSNALVVTNADGLTIRDNVFTNNHRDMQFTTCGGPCTGGQLYITDNPGAPVTNLTITGNTIATSPNPPLDSASGIEIGNARTAPLGPIVINDNDVHGNPRSGITVHGGSGGHEVTISGNRLADNSFTIWEGAWIAGQITVHGSPGVAVHDNELRKNGDPPVTASFGTTRRQCTVAPGENRCIVEVHWDISGVPAGAEPVLVVAGAEVASGASGTHDINLAHGTLKRVEILLNPGDHFPLAILEVFAGS